MPSLPSVMATMAELYNANFANGTNHSAMQNFSYATADSTSSTSAEEDGPSKSDVVDFGDLADSTDPETQEHLKQLVEDISQGKFSFPDFIASSTTNTKAMEEIEKPSKSANRKRKKLTSTPTNIFPQQSTTILTNLMETGGAQKIRKLKLYTVEEKIDIIDYAKIIGNRAAGREFNVAESSIREWRKNEERLRRQIEASTSGTQHFEANNQDLIANIDKYLVEFTNERKDTVDWYLIREKARDLWRDIVNGTELDENPLNESNMNISMGWIARFMRRNEKAVPKLAPPIIATSTALNAQNGSVTMVKKMNPSNTKTNTEPKNEKPSKNAGSRRKCLQPVRRITDATLLTTTNPPSQKSPITTTTNPISTFVPQNLGMKITQAPPNLASAVAQNTAVVSFLAAAAAAAATTTTTLNNNSNNNNTNSNVQNLALWLLKNYAGAQNGQNVK